MIKYSFIIPAYNVEKYIGDTIESALLASDDSTEIIVINDGSTDGTDSVICSKVCNTDKRLNIINQVNQGVSVARNNGIDAANGEYIIFCDGDDLCAPNLLIELNKYIESSADLYLWGFEDLEIENGSHRVKQKEFKDEISNGYSAFKSMLFGNNKIRLGSFAVRKDLLERYDIRYTVGCPLSQDVEFMYKCLAMSSKVQTIDQVLFTYVQHTGSVMYRYNLNRFEAPRTTKRIYEYVKVNTNILDDVEINEYLKNGFYLLHSMYAFNACLPYLGNLNQRRQFIKDYYNKYYDVELELKRIYREIKIWPEAFNKKRRIIFLLNRQIYTYLFSVKA